ncbi:uncharacterized protein LOC133203919 [Saccostrea echinata]|uniref:uncharacterized protein LOC133203919 n=1 Tax=Saccostrea echinata TaxID=191078 RepID=UPI002A81FFD8|nr:uncharacterized protein LOC133203919 [Saccostrea echinata]
MASGSVSDDHMRFSLVGIAILEQLSEILRFILSANVPPQDLENEIRRSIHSFKFNAEQWKLIKNAAISGYSDFDITISYTLIRNLCKKVSKPTNGWGAPALPSTNETTTGDDVERIRIIRNEIFGHSNCAAISEKEFTKYWKIISDLCKRMESMTGIIFSQKLQSLQTCILDKKLYEKYQKALEEACFVSRQITELKEILTDIRADLNETKGTQNQTEPGNNEKCSSPSRKHDCMEVRTLSSGFLEDSMNLSAFGDSLDHLPKIPLYLRQLLDNDNTFHETEEFSTSYKYLLKFGSVAIVGPKGSGKSSIAIKILKILDRTVLNGKTCVSRFTFSVQGIEDGGGEQCVTILYLCDVLEDINFHPTHFKEVISAFNVLYNTYVSKGSMFVVLTVNEGTWEKYLELERTHPFKCMLFPDSRCVRMGITEKQSIEILRNHLLNQGFKIINCNSKCKSTQSNLIRCDWELSDEYMSLLAPELAQVAKKEGIRFHTISQMISLNKKLFEKRRDILYNGFFDTFQNFLYEMRFSSDSRHQDVFCILVFVVFNGGIVFLNQFVERTVLYESICRFFSNAPRSLREIETLLDCEMKSYVYTLHGHCYALQNNILVDVILSICTKDKKSQAFFVEHCCWTLLLSRVRRHSCSESSPFVVKVHPAIYPRLVQRLVSEVKLEKTMLTLICDHVIMESEHFKFLWKKQLEWSQFLNKRKEENHEDYFSSGEYEIEGLTFDMEWFL